MRLVGTERSCVRAGCVRMQIINLETMQPRVLNL